MKPEVIIIDEIGTKAEALACGTIAQRGVKLIGTAHGDSLESLMKNPALSDLIGGIQSVVLGDAEARKQGKNKSTQQRRGASPFEALIEMHDRNEWVVHRSVADMVDKLLDRKNPHVEARKMNETGGVTIHSVSYKSVHLEQIEAHKIEEDPDPRIIQMEQELASLLSTHSRRKYILSGQFPDAVTHMMQRYAMRMVQTHPQMWDRVDILIEGRKASPNKRKIAQRRGIPILDLERFALW